MVEHDARFSKLPAAVLAAIITARAAELEGINALATTRASIVECLQTNDSQPLIGRISDLPPEVKTDLRLEVHGVDNFTEAAKRLARAYTASSAITFVVMVTKADGRTCTRYALLDGTHQLERSTNEWQALVHQPQWCPTETIIHTRVTTEASNPTELSQSIVCALDRAGVDSHKVASKDIGDGTTVRSWILHFKS